MLRFVIKEIDGEGFVKTYTYTKRNQKKTETNPLGGTTVNTYDRDDNLVSMTDPNGSKIEYVYDDFGRIIKAILPDVPGVSERKTVEIVYDSRGNALKMAETGGKTSEWSYDSRNRKLIETVSGEGAVSVVTEWEYDGVGNVIKEIIGRAESKTEYDELNRVVLQEYADGQREIYKYDVLSRVIMTEDAMGVQKSNKYNSLNKVIETIDGLGNSTEYYYDVFGNCTKTTEPNLGGSGEQVWNRNYNVWGQPVTEYNNAGQNWSYEYDKRGFVKKRIEPNGTVTDIVYDGNGNLLSETKILGEKTERKSYSYDAVGFLYNAIDNGIVSIINSAGGQYEPNAWGLVTSIETRQGGKVLLSRYEYDEALNNTKIVYPDGFEVCSGYNGLGQLLKIGDEYNDERFASGGVYNEAGRPVTISAGNGTARTKSWDVNTNLLTGYGWNIDLEKERIIEWNNQGNIVSISGGKNVSYSYDKLSRLVREITDAKVEKSNRKDSGIGEAFTFGYAEADVDGNGSLLYSNQVMKFDYYASSVGASLGGTKLVNAVRLYGNSSRLDEKYMEIYLSSEGLDGSWYKAETFCIEKDESGLKVIFAEPIEAGYVKIHSTWDERDVAYSPVDCSEIRGTPYDLLEVFIIQKGRRNEWSYDARGNRIDSTVDNNSLVIEYYENIDLLKKYGEWYFNYDANGNMIARGKNGTKKIAAASNELFEGYVFSSDTGELWTYEYDLSNRLVKVNYSNNGTNGLKEKTGYLYDYRGLCIAKTSVKGTDYYEYTADGRLIYTERSDYVADYVYSGTSIFAEVRKQNGNDETFYHHTDHLGTTEVITDESGTVVWKAF